MAKEHVTLLPFDLYQRYSTVAEVVSLVEESRGHTLMVLDVGGCAFALDGINRFLPIVEFLPQTRTVVLDTPEISLPNYVAGSGEHPPFADACFDVVVATDTLEHIKPGMRTQFIRELDRVSHDFIVIASPFNQGTTVVAEQILDKYISSALGVEHLQLREHLSLGLPDKKEVTDYFKARGYAFVEFPSGNIYQWLDMMLVRHHALSLPDGATLVGKLDEFYNMACAGGDVTPPCYRHVFVASKRGATDLLDTVKTRALMGADRISQAGEGRTLPQSLFTSFLVIRQAMDTDRQLRQQVTDKERHIAHLETLVMERDQAIAGLRRELERYAEHLLAATAELRNWAEKSAAAKTELSESGSKLLAAQAELEQAKFELEQTKFELERVKSGRLLTALMLFQKLFRGKTYGRGSN